jgi:hypothetical integral membrane protein (TIGR02206 family)
MLALQLGSLALAFLGPLAMWAAHRRRPHPKLERTFALSIAWLLVAVFLAGLVQKYFEGKFTADQALPMHLCDWAAFAVVAALIWRSQTCFELGYFWGLCGTLQALFTPAIDHEVPWWQQLGFFLDHAGIVAGVLILLLVPRMRPRSFLRIFVWSEIYLAATLIVNAIAGSNYGFLTHRPITASMLDLFPDDRWLYVLTINAVALLFFAVAYLPWLIADRRIPVDSQTAAPTPPA